MNSINSMIGKTMPGGRAIAEMLNVCEVGPIFGMGGFQLLPYYEGIRDLEMTHYLVNDERNGAFAADAYARMTNRPGVCDATLGPGTTNLVTALVESLNAGIPIIAISGNTHRSHSWKNMTQESKQLEILRPAVKEIIRIEKVDRIPELIRRAFSIATSGRPGPVLIDVPEDIAHEEYKFSTDDFYVNERVTNIPSLRVRPDKESINKTAELLSQSERPLILAGGGIHLSDAYEELNTLSKRYQIPVANTLSGKGSLACSDNLSVGLFGRYSRIANDLIDSSDLILVIGCKLGEIATKRYELPNLETKIIHIDIDPEEIERWLPTRLGLWGDAKETIGELNSTLKENYSNELPKRTSYLAEIKERKKEWYDEAKKRYLSKEVPINMGRLINSLNNKMPENSTLIVDGGFSAHWGGLLYDTKSTGRVFIANRGFASIGYGLPASLGACLANRQRNQNSKVVGITGDGGLNMTIGEIETALRAKAEFVLVVVNNAASGYIKSLQHMVYGEGNYQSSSLMETDYAELSKSYGCHGIRVEDPEKIEEALEEAFSNTGAPTVVDVIVTRNPAEMLPGVDNRIIKMQKGDRPV